ncbi:MAG: polysaccharide deacetylase family protein, partial [Candidatus Roizmanbacteria bacterium]|nr:polysaccharide deacetylase family protein [Candidatus Roizmanbacteria bacterium]
MKKGTLCISFDTELLWGRHEGNWKLFIPRAEKTRRTIDRLLSILAEYSVPATWAIVGNLYIANKKKPLWHAPDVVKKIRSHANQEIGCHSFSHIRFGDPLLSKDTAERDIKQCVEMAKKENIILKSFVFPYNSVGHLNLLKKYGFTSYRGDDQYSTRSPVKKLQLLLDLFTPMGSSVNEPRRVQNLIEIPGSFYFLSARGFRKYIPRGTRYRKAKHGIDRAIAEKKIFH